MDNPRVSICCITYNQDAFIAQTIESFLAQETNFDFEIVVHDDASTDTTGAILHDFEQRYPNKIRVLYERENQYSQGTTCISGTFVLPVARGYYVAMCEGDDYWTDPHKLQRQYDYLEGHPNCTLCVHDAMRVDAQTGAEQRLQTGVHTERDFSIEEVIVGGGGLFATNSMFFRRSDWEGYFAWRPSFCPVDDYPMAIYFALHGTVHYLSLTMSAYRVNAPHSWSAEQTRNGQRYRAAAEQTRRMLLEIDEMTDKRYHDAIIAHIAYGVFTGPCTREARETLQTPEVRAAIKALPPKKRLKFRGRVVLWRLGILDAVMKLRKA